MGGVAFIARTGTGRVFPLPLIRRQFERKNQPAPVGLPKYTIHGKALY
jgi:hypothetical protein